MLHEYNTKSLCDAIFLLKAYRGEAHETWSAVPDSGPAVGMSRKRHITRMPILSLKDSALSRCLRALWCRTTDFSNFFRAPTRPRLSAAAETENRWSVHEGTELLLAYLPRRCLDSCYEEVDLESNEPLRLCKQVEGFVQYDEHVDVAFRSRLVPGLRAIEDDVTQPT